MRARGWEGVFIAALDVIEPFGVLGAQLLWTAQPTLGVFVNREAVGGLARALEAPDGIERLRAQLEGDTPPTLE